jgi:hypothetical protein
VCGRSGCWDFENIEQMDELMEDNQWYNIQDPVKQMITSITKAVRTQSAGIRDLDRKIGLIFEPCGK